MLVVKTFFLSFGEGFLGVTSTEQRIQSCQTQELPSTLGHSSAAHGSNSCHPPIRLLQ